MNPCGQFSRATGQGMRQQPPEAQDCSEDGKTIPESGESEKKVKNRKKGLA